MTARSRTDFDADFMGEEFRISRERMGVYDEEKDRDVVHEKISIFDDEGLVAGLEYEEDTLSDFERLENREEDDVEVYAGETGMDLSDFREVYKSLKSGGQEDIFEDEEIGRSEIPSFYAEV